MTAVTGSQDAPARVFYGWTVVGTVFVILTVASGLGFYNTSVILEAAAGELDVSVGAVSGGTALFFGVSGTTGFVLARKMETVDLRLFYLAGGLVGAAALGALRWVDTVVHLYLFFALFGVAFALGGLVPGTTLVTRWFHRRRSVAISVASTGLSLGGIILTPVSAWLIDQRTLAGAGPILAVMWLVGIVPLGLLLVRSRPADLGLRPDGDGVVSGDNPGTAPTTMPSQSDSVSGTATTTAPGQSDNVGDGDGEPGVTFGVARRTRFFWQLCVGYALVFFAQVGTLAHLFNVVTERADRATASAALSLLAGTSVVGRLLGGVVVLRVPSWVLTSSLAFLQGAAIASVGLSFSRLTILGSAIVLGISVGNLLMLQPLVLAEAFGVVHYSRIYSFSQMFSTIGIASGPLALGLLHDAADYRTALLIAGLASVLGFGSFLAAGPTSRVAARWS